MPEHTEESTVGRVRRYRIVASLFVGMVSVGLFAYFFSMFFWPWSPYSLVNPIMRRVVSGAIAVGAAYYGGRALRWLLGARIVSAPSLSGSHIFFRADSEDVSVPLEDVAQVGLVDDAIMLGNARLIASASRGDAAVITVPQPVGRAAVFFAVGPGTDDFVDEIERRGVPVTRATS